MVMGLCAVAGLSGKYYKTASRSSIPPAGATSGFRAAVTMETMPDFTINREKCENEISPRRQSTIFCRWRLPAFLA
jgi:hypothetical protein